VVEQVLGSRPRPWRSMNSFITGAGSCSPLLGTRRSSPWRSRRRFAAYCRRGWGGGLAKHAFSERLGFGPAPRTRLRRFFSLFFLAAASMVFSNATCYLGGDTTVALFRACEMARFLSRFVRHGFEGKPLAVCTLSRTSCTPVKCTVFACLFARIIVKSARQQERSSSCDPFASPPTELRQFILFLFLACTPITGGYSALETGGLK
jgi:hypothetical protein